MRNPEDAYKSKPDVKMPLFESCEHKNTYELPVTGAKVCLDCPNVEIAHARHNDPKTSKQAAASVTNTEQVRRNIKFILEQWGALTDEEIASYYALGCRPPSTPSGLRTRRKELVAAGEVVAAGIGTSAAGRNSTTWKVAK